MTDSTCLNPKFQGVCHVLKLDDYDKSVKNVE